MIRRPKNREQSNQNTRDLLDWVRGALGDGSRRRVPGVELISRWPAGRPDRLNKAEAELLAILLERQGIGIEPDVRFGGTPPPPAGNVVLFTLPTPRSAPTSATPNPNYASAVALLQLAVAAADGAVADSETRAMLDHISRGVGLADTEQARLHAHLDLVLQRPPTLAALRKRAAALDDTQRQEAAGLLLAVAAADGAISPSETERISRLFTVLGFESTDAYAQIHAAATTSARRSSDPLFSARTAGRPAADFTLPARPPAPTDRRGRHAAFEEMTGPAPIELDPDLLARTRRDSEQVAALLADIFADTVDEPLRESASLTAPAAADGDGHDPDGDPGVAGLDAPHSQLLRALTTAPQWERAAFTDLCGTHRLLPDGALDTLNEAAVEATGEPVCEGHDPIDVNSYALEEMLR